MIMIWSLLGDINICLNKQVLNKNKSLRVITQCDTVCCLP